MEFLRRIFGRLQTPAVPKTGLSAASYGVRKFLDTQFSQTHEIVTIDSTDAPITLDPESVQYGFGGANLPMEDAVVEGAMREHYGEFWAAVGRQKPNVNIMALGGALSGGGDMDIYVTALLATLQEHMDLSVHSAVFDVFDYEISEGVRRPILVGFQFRESSRRIVLATSGKVLPTSKSRREVDGEHERTHCDGPAAPTRDVQNARLGRD